MKHRHNIEDLRLMEAAGVNIVYHADGADTAEITLMPEAYASLAWQVGDRVELYYGGQKVFSGVLPNGEQRAVNGGNAEVVSVSLMSDFYVLDGTVYAKQNAAGEVVFPSVREGFSELQVFAANVFNWASGWEGSKIESALVCDVSGRIPTPQSNGTNSCAQLLQDALQWTPGAVIVQRYGAEGDELRLTTPEAFEPLGLSKADLVTSVSLQRREDLRPPVCALVGGAHVVLPPGGDVRELGAFVYAVPLRDKKGGGGPAGAAPASAKMIVRGVPIPDRYQFERGVEEFKTSAVVANSDTDKFLKQFFPEYAKWVGRLKAGACVVSVVPATALHEGAEDTEDEDAQAIPANYQDSAEAWLVSAPYVLVEGSFNASSNAKKNVKGLRWCKASMTLSVVVREDELKAVEMPTVLELFPGRHRNDEGELVYYANLTLDAVLINRRRKIYDPATNKLLRGDGEWSSEEEDDEGADAGDYVAAMTAYYHASRDVYTEGSIGMLDVGRYAPHELTGRMVTLSGFRDEWASMKAVVRGVMWDCVRKRIELQVGPRSVLGFGEQLERRLMAKMTGVNTARSLAVPYDPLDEGAASEEEAALSVSPSISAGLGAHTKGRWRDPWTLYPVVTGLAEDGTPEVEWWLAGGTLNRGKYSWNVADTNKQIVETLPGEKGWSPDAGKVRVRFYRKDGVLLFDIFQGN